MARTATGIDIGSATAKLLRGEVKGNSFVVTGFALAANPDGTLESGWHALEPGFKPTACRIGLTGRDVNARYTRVPRVPDWQLRKLMKFEAAEIGGQSESTVASDFNVLPEIPEIEGEDVVVLCMAREALLDTHMNGLAGLKGKLDAFTPNAIALYNAFLRYGVVMEDTVLVANIGRENIDVILVRGTDLLFARNLSGGSKLFDDTLAQRFGISEARAAEFKEQKGSLTARTGAGDPNVEKATHAMMAPAGQLLSLLQSTVVFCKSQIKLSTLKLDRVFLCGGGAALDGLSAYLSSGLGVPCELFDPFVVVDVSKLDAESAELLEEHRLEAVVALGLATSASDPDAYTIEILPESVRKRRDFVQGKLFLVASAVLAALYLGLYAWKQSRNLGVARAEAQSLEARFRKAKSNDQQTEALLAENEALAAFAVELHELAGSGEQLARTFAAVEQHLPPDFWFDQMTTSWGKDEDLGVPVGEELPILRLRGRAREGTDAPSELFEEFVGSLRRSLPEGRIKERMNDTQSLFTIDLTMVAPPAPPAPPEEGAEDGEGDEAVGAAGSAESAGEEG